MAGYSKKSLSEKLGMKAGMRAILMNAPKIDGLKLPEGFILVKTTDDHLNYIHFFTKERRELVAIFPQLKDKLTSSGMIWISWPKKSSGVRTDLDENLVREIGLKNGMVDVKVAAIDDIWSGLKFVFRLKDRFKN